MNDKKLFRSTKNRMLCGVCGGLGIYTGMDPTVIRVIYAVLSVATGVGLGIILYFILSVIIPEDNGIVD